MHFTPEQIKLNREQLSSLLCNVSKILDIASEEKLIAGFFGISNQEATYLWIEISRLRDKIEGIVPILEEKDVDF